MRGFTTLGAYAFGLTTFASSGIAPSGIAWSSAMANPIYTLTISDAAGTISQTDGGTGLINYSGTLGGFSISSMTVQDLNPTNPLDVAFGSQDIFRASGSDALHVYVTVSNLTEPLPQALTVGTTSQANFQGSKIMGWSSQTYFDAADHTGTAGLVTLLSQSSGNTTKNAFTSTTEGTTTLAANPFSYTVDFTLDLLANQFANGAGATTDVILPEPKTWPLLISGVIGMLFLRRTTCRTGSAPA